MYILSSLYRSDVLPSPQKPKGQTRDIERNVTIAWQTPRMRSKLRYIFRQYQAFSWPSLFSQETASFSFRHATMTRRHVALWISLLSCRTEDDTSVQYTKHACFYSAYHIRAACMYVTTCHAREFRRLYRFKQTCSLLTFWRRLGQRKEFPHDRHRAGGSLTAEIVSCR
jgi:hypothetical protein